MTPLPMPADPMYASPITLDRRGPGARSAGWVAIHHVACPLGHRVKHGWVAVGPHTRRCGFKERGTGNECALLTWELWVPHASVVFVAAIDRTELESIRVMTVEQTLAYLGAPMWPLRAQSA